MKCQIDIVNVLNLRGKDISENSPSVDLNTKHPHIQPYFFLGVLVHYLKRIFLKEYGSLRKGLQTKFGPQLVVES